MSFNLATILNETALADAGRHRPATFAGTTTTYRRARRAVRPVRGRAAGGRAAARPGGRPAAAERASQFLIAYFGALKAGLVVLPLNPLLKAPEDRVPPDRLGGGHA